MGGGCLTSPPLTSAVEGIVLVYQLQFAGGPPRDAGKKWK